MAIRIVRNEAGNCINFYGASNPTYWNSCLSGQVDSTDPNAVNVINDIITAETGVTQYEFFRVPFTEFVDAEGNAFATAQECAAYITEKANVIGLSGEGIDLTGSSVCFSLDDTHTSIMLDNGYSYGVNTIKAEVDTDGTIHIKSELGDITYFFGLTAGNACDVDGTPIAGGLQDIVNYLNELFTVGPFESVVISDPYSTMVADVSGVNATMSEIGNGIDPAGADVYGSTASGSLNGYKSTETIDQAGEYFTFDIRNEGQIGFGLVHSQTSYDDGHYSGNATYANPTTFGTSNSAHYGFQFSHWFHPTPNGSWTNYGANTSYVQGPGWYSANTQFEGRDEWLAGDPIKIKVGIDENGFIAISSLKDDGVTWVMHARTGYPVPDGAEFHLGIKTGDTVSRVYTLPKVHLLEPAAPTMNFRYIESPDGEYQYPLFSSTEEVEYYDTVNGGSGTYHQHVYDDDPTFTTWYMPDNGDTHGATSAPTSAITFEGNPINWTEITSLTNADLVPAPYTTQTIQVNELQSVNIQTQPQDVGYTTTIVDNDGSGLISFAGNISGTAPEVTDNNVNNPSDDYTFTITRTNSYGNSASATLTLQVNNLTAPATAISGFNHHSGSDPLVDSNTMDDGSAIHMNNTLADGKRLIIEQSYVETNILPALQGAGDKYYIGLAVNGHDFATVEDADFDSAIVWEYETASSHSFKFLNNGTVVNNIIVSSLTDAVYDYAIEINGTSAWLIACNVNAINTEPSPADGGSFSHTYESTNLDESAPHTIHMAVVSTQGDFSTSGISQLDTPAAPVSNLTSWNKALDFSGNSERAQQSTSNSDRIPIKMNGSNNQVAAPSAGQTVSSGHPWATAIVFKSDKNSSNQHIWNLGEGAGTTDDNIYLRTDATGKLYFGWGRSGDLCEMLIHPANTGTGWTLTSSNWYGIYIAHNGTRYGADNTTSLMADAFDIRLMGSSNSWATVDGSDTNLSVAADWTITGDGRMNRQFQGDMTIGGRGANRNFHGKVASFVSTTLRVGVAMPTTAEIELMITDPIKWLNDYKVGQTFRLPWQTSNAAFNFAIGDGSSGSSTQVWLMGDGGNDSYSNMIRNRVQPNDQNNAKLNMISMVSNDIQNVTISGLS